MFLKDIYKNKKYVISFEVFPPKKDYEVDTLYETIKELKVLNPDFVSVTYGAGGGTRDKTVEISSKIKNEFNIEVMAHFTCINSDKDFISKVLNYLENNNINNILALRGDPPVNSDNNDYYGDFKYAYELVDFIKNKKNWSIAVAGYPTGHPDAVSFDDDINYLKLKVDNGADIIITQLFFDNNEFYKFSNLALKKGINKPIIPGIFPILNFKTIKKITSLSNAKIPKNLLDKLEKYQDKNEEVEKIGIEYAVKQSEDLLKNNVNGLHFYTMNKSVQIKNIINNLKHIIY